MSYETRLRFSFDLWLSFANLSLNFLENISVLDSFCWISLLSCGLIPIFFIFFSKITLFYKSWAKGAGCCFSAVSPFLGFKCHSDWQFTNGLGFLQVGPRRQGKFRTFAARNKLSSSHTESVTRNRQQILSALLWRIRKTFEGNFIHPVVLEQSVL